MQNGSFDMQSAPVDRPPYVEFFLKPVEDRAASIKEGCYQAKDVVFAKVFRAGSRDVLEVEAEIWIKQLEEKARGKLVPFEWPGIYKTALRNWQEGAEIPSHGTPIATWPGASPSAIEQLIRAKVRTVEDLAELSESSFEQIGIGALGLKLKAQAYLRAGTEAGKLAEENVALRLQTNELKAALEKLTEQVKTLAANQAKPATIKG